MGLTDGSKTCIAKRVKLWLGNSSNETNFFGGSLGDDLDLSCGKCITKHSLLG